MRDFTFNQGMRVLEDPSIVRDLTALYEYRGKQALLCKARPDVLDALQEFAKIQSTDASNRIEGISTSAKRLNSIVADHAQPTTRDEQEIAGYRDVLALIHESHDYIDVTPNVILQLHSMLYRHSGHAFAGHWKDSDNAIVERAADGSEHVRFRPVPAAATPHAMEALCAAYNRATSEGSLDPLILASHFILDFTCIHPFTDGNGRMSRLLTLLLLYRAKFFVGKYVSIEGEIARTKDSYYDALQQSSIGWNAGDNDYAPFDRYTMGVVLAAYKDFESRLEGVVGTGMSKSERIKRVLSSSVGKVTKADILRECPDISLTTIERTLHDLLGQGRIAKVGAGRATGYVWKG
jgi:Fic family protein